MNELLREIEEIKCKLTEQEIEICKRALNTAGWVHNMEGLNSLLKDLNIPTENRDPEWQAELEGLFANPFSLDLDTLLYVVQEEKEIHVNAATDASAEMLNVFVSMGGQNNKDGVIEVSKLKDTMGDFSLTLDIDQLLHEFGVDRTGRLDFDEFISLLIDDEELQTQVMLMQEDFKKYRKDNAVNPGTLEKLATKYSQVIPWEYIEQFLEGVAEYIPMVKQNKELAKTKVLDGPHVHVEPESPVSLHASRLDVVKSGSLPRSETASVEPEDGEPKSFKDLSKLREQRKEQRREERRRALRRGGKSTEVQNLIFQKHLEDLAEVRRDKLDVLIGLHNQSMRHFRRTHRIRPAKPPKSQRPKPPIPVAEKLSPLRKRKTAYIIRALGHKIAELETWKDAGLMSEHQMKRQQAILALLRQAVEAYCVNPPLNRPFSPTSSDALPKPSRIVRAPYMREKRIALTPILQRIAENAYAVDPVIEEHTALGAAPATKPPPKKLTPLAAAAQQWLDHKNEEKLREDQLEAKRIEEELDGESRTPTASLEESEEDSEAGGETEKEKKKQQDTLPYMWPSPLLWWYPNFMGLPPTTTELTSPFFYPTTSPDSSYQPSKAIPPHPLDVDDDGNPKPVVAPYPQMAVPGGPLYSTFPTPATTGYQYAYPPMYSAPILAAPPPFAPQPLQQSGSTNEEEQHASTKTPTPPPPVPTSAGLETDRRTSIRQQSRNNMPERISLGGAVELTKPKTPTPPPPYESPEEGSPTPTPPLSVSPPPPPSPPQLAAPPPLARPAPPPIEVFTPFSSRPPRTLGGDTKASKPILDKIVTQTPLLNRAVEKPEEGTMTFSHPSDHYSYLSKLNPKTQKKFMRYTHSTLAKQQIALPSAAIKVDKYLKKHKGGDSVHNLQTLPCKRALKHKLFHEHGQADRNMDGELSSMELIFNSVSFKRRALLEASKPGGGMVDYSTSGPEGFAIPPWMQSSAIVETDDGFEEEMQSTRHKRALGKTVKPPPDKVPIPISAGRPYGPKKKKKKKRVTKVNVKDGELEFVEELVEVEEEPEHYTKQKTPTPEPPKVSVTEGRAKRPPPKGSALFNVFKELSQAPETAEAAPVPL